MIAVGIGAHSSVTARDVLIAAGQVRGTLGETAGVFATFSDAKFVDSVRQAALSASVKFISLPLAELVARSADCKSLSPRSLQLHGVASIAEAAALAAAGPGSTLLSPRVIFGNVTVATAMSADHERALP